MLLMFTVRMDGSRKYLLTVRAVFGQLRSLWQSLCTKLHEARFEYSGGFSGRMANAAGHFRSFPVLRRKCAHLQAG